MPRRSKFLACLAGGLLTLSLLDGCKCERATRPQASKNSKVRSLASASAVAPAASGRPASPEHCPHFLPGKRLGRAAIDALKEASGLVVSRKNPGVLWSHNDAGSGAKLYAMTTEGAELGTYHLKGDAVDWEDLATGAAKDPGDYYLYIADTGTNATARHRVSVLRVLEPHVKTDHAPKKHKLGAPDRFEFTYPDQAVHDAEALMVDPRSQDLFLVTKPRLGTPMVYRAPALDKPAGTRVLEEVAELTVFEKGSRRGSLVTAADISQTGEWILVRTYTVAYLWVRGPEQSVADALRTEPCSVPLAREPQGETIAFAPDSQSYFTISEGNEPKIFEFRLDR